MISGGELGVYKALYLNKGGLHIREISKKADLTLPSVFNHIKRGEERGTISCETKGRMKICKLNFESKFLVPILQEIELSRLGELPERVRRALNDFINNLQEKPLIISVFGSYATGKQTKSSDLDVLLVYQRIDNELMKKIEVSVSRIKGRTTINIQPVSISYDEFQKEIMDLENEFMKDVRKYVVAITGMELYINFLGRFYQ